MDKNCKRCDGLTLLPREKPARRTKLQVNPPPEICWRGSRRLEIGPGAPFQGSFTPNGLRSRSFQLIHNLNFHWLLIDWLIGNSNNNVNIFYFCNWLDLFLTSSCVIAQVWGLQKIAQPDSHAKARDSHLCRFARQQRRRQPKGQKETRDGC